MPDIVVLPAKEIAPLYAWGGSLRLFVDKRMDEVPIQGNCPVLLELKRNIEQSREISLKR